MTTQHTPWPWLYSGNTVYTLMHHGWKKGVEQFRNRASFAFQFDSTVSEEERKATINLTIAAPDLLQELRNIADANTSQWDDKSDFEAWAKSRARAAIAKATGAA